MVDLHLTSPGDGMTTNMITAARLIGHKSINGKYQTTMQMDKFPVLGHQMVGISHRKQFLANHNRPTRLTATSPILPTVLPPSTPDIRAL